MGEQNGAGTATVRTIDIDYNTQLLLEMLEDKMRDEPPVPDEQQHIGARYTEIARAHEQWQREIDALRMLCGVRLVNQAFAA